jgi:N,N-dimethylformamidase
MSHEEMLFCRFDFSTSFSGMHLSAIEGAAVVGRFVNHPTRRIIGCDRPDVLSGWEDTEPAAYSAIHVHEYDLTDAAWPEAVQFSIPQSLKSGIYAINVVSELGQRLRLPFVIRATPGLESPTLYLLPTNTYIAYANERLAFGDRAEALVSEVQGVTLSDLDKLVEQPGVGRIPI